MKPESVLFVHSTGTGPLLWSGVPDAVIGDRQRLTPSNLGYPPEPLVERGVKLTAKDDAQHVLAAMKRDSSDRIDRVHLVAHSYGALVALLVAQELGDRVLSIFFYEPVLFGALANATREAYSDLDVDPAAMEQARSFLAHPWFLHDEERLGRAEWLEMFIDYWNRPGSWSKMPQEMREQSLAFGWKMSQEVRSCFFDNTSFEEWKIDVPTTIMFGERSPPASRAMARLLAHGRPNVTLVEAPKLNHMAPLIAPAAVHEEIGRHLARFGVSRRREEG